MPLSNLNQEQLAAASASAGHNLIIASAGTGKTSTIVARIGYLLNSGIKPERILLLTFTNKAATEMMERLNKKFPKSITNKVLAGTFHAISYKLLKSMNKNIILKQPSELKTLLKSLVNARQFHHLSELSAYGGAYLYDIFSLFTNSALDISFKEWFSQKNQDQAVFADIYEDILREFESEKARFGYVDFNDLLLKMRTELKNENAPSFDEILVDEYQDTNSLQSSLIDAFNSKSLFCVGDFDQSIYAFNGANIEIIGSFKHRYKDAKIYTLNTNYRSSAKILKLANRVISINPRLYEKELKVSRIGEFKSPQLLVYNELISQYKGIAQIIKDSKYDKSDIAVIFRNNSSADGIEIALKELGISSKRRGSGSFFDSLEIKALICLLALSLNGRDIMSFIEIFGYAKGVGEAKAKQIFDLLSQLGDGDMRLGLLYPNQNASLTHKRRKNYELGLFDDMLDYQNATNIDESAFNANFKGHQILNYLNQNGANFLNDLYCLLASLKNTTNTQNAINTAINSRIYANIAQFLAHKKALRKNFTLNEEAKQKAYENIITRAKSLALISNTYKELASFYNFLVLGKSELNSGNGVNLLSVHSSKGLEFGQVFVIDLANTRFPNLRLMAQGGSLEEERRLFYVAVTRAKDELYLSYAKYDKNGKTSFEASQFIQEAGFVIE